MSWLPLILILQLLCPDLVTTTSSWLRVETGHQSIEIDGRDSYLGYFTRIHFHDVTCIQGLLIHCLKPLTGAEEIEILLSQCPRGNWRVVHYTNTKEEFRLKWPFNARQMMVVSRQPLNVIDVQVQACQIDNSTLSSLSSGCKHDHGSRHGRSGPVRATEYGRKRRYKREIMQTEGYTEEVIPRMSQMEIFENKVVETGKVLRIEEGARIVFGDNVSLIVYGSLIVNGSKYAPVKFEAAGSKWKGLQINTQKSSSSSLKYLNISQSEIGLSVANGSIISIQNVVVDGNDVGLKIQTDSSSIRISNTFAVNNAGPGFHFSGKGTVELDTCISASNKEHGIYFEDGLSLSLRKCNLFSNSKNAIHIKDSERLEVKDSVIDSNGAGIEVSGSSEVDFYLTFTSVNISNHHYGPVVHVKQSKTVMEIDNCSIFDNYFGAIHLDDNHIQLEIANSKFLRNRGKIVYLPLLIAGRIIIGKNVFSSNQFNDYADGEAVIEVITSARDSEDASINVFQNEFSKNVMNNIIHLRRVTGSEVNAIISDSDFHGNLAQTIVRSTSMKATIQYNFLHNVQSSCDISVPMPSHSEESKNYWGYDNHKEILEHICANNDSYSNLFYSQDLNVSPSTPFPSPPKLDVTSIPLPPLDATYNLIKKQETPYIITEDVVIKADQTVIVEPGSRILFSPGKGILIEEKGKLYLNGSVGNEILLSSNGDAVWKGISLKPGGLIFVSDTIIEDPSVGLWIDSDRSTFTRVQINRPTVHGIELTGNSAAQHDFGGSSINDALSTAIVVDERRSGLLISNVSIKNPAVSGIDFVSPSADLVLRNINISSAHSHSIHISEYPTAPLQSLLLEDIQVNDQKRGHSGIFVNSGWITNLTLNRIRAEGNSVPSVVLSIDCNTSPSMSTIRNSEFLNNLDTVVLMQLGECGALNLNRNIFRSNNQNGRGGVLRVDVQPSQGVIPITIASNNFIENKGDFTAFLSSESSGIIGKFENNSLEENSNSVATVVVTSPFYSLHNNRFSNPQSFYEIEARGDGSWNVDGSHNWWGTTDEKQIETRLKNFECTIMFRPIRTDDFHPEVTITHPDVQVPMLASQYEACAQANYCSYRGTCIAGLCVCPIGYIGADCSVLVGCKNNCSSNGACGLFNTCSCNEGWTSVDCSVPICKNSCGNHGFCVGRDECKCDENWTGPDCLQPTCSTTNCIHGQCDLNDSCICTQGYEGRSCSRPVCSSCSLNGRCTSPGVCECFDDYGGNDCSECVGSSCNQCDFDCDHGTCEPSTRTCSCSAGWTGAACDVCPTTCVTEPPTLVYIQPSTSPLMMSYESIVSVFGKFFHKSKDNKFTCIFGTQKIEGLRVSSTLIRCPVPSNITVGRHIFSVESVGVVAQPIDGRPLHFTVYDSCQSSECRGTCYGPLCLCPRGKTGLFCEIIELKPEIDKLFLTNQVANKAYEGVPYIVYLPSMPGTVLTVNSTIPDLNFDSSRSLLEWPDPVGQLQPHVITVSANSLAGESRLTWNLAIEPSYEAMIDDVTSDGKSIIVKGHIDNSKFGGMPIVIHMQNDNGFEEEVEVSTSQNGDFLYSVLPNGGGDYTITARHPGRADKVSTRSIRINAEVPELPAENYKNGKLIGLPDKSCVPTILGKSKSKLTEELVGTGKVVRIEFLDEDPKRMTTTILLTCANHKEFLTINKDQESTQRQYEVFPNRLILQQNKTHSLSKVIEVVVRGPSFKSPVKLSSTTNRIYIIASSLRENENGEEDFHVSFQMDVSYPHNGTISAQMSDQELYSLPYSIVDESSELFRDGSFRMKICLNDELETLSTTSGSKSALATLAITNLQLKKDFAESHSVNINGPAAEFLIPEGMYEVVAQSPNHKRYQEFLRLSPHNSSICLQMKSLSSFVPTEFENGEWHITSINKQTDLFPSLIFQPDNINRSVSSVYVTVRGDKPGIVAPRTISNKLMNWVPRVRSVSVNDSFWVQLEHLNSASNSSECDVFLFDVSFDFLPEGADGIISLSSPILIEFNRRKLNSQPKLCRVNKEEEEIESATTTNILCDCSQGAKAQCRSIYRSPASCGSSWKRIADDTVSLHVVSAFLLMISECNDVQLNFTELHQTLQCVSSLESKCPLSTTRMKRFTNESSLVDLLMFQSDPIRSLRQISSSSESFINPLNVLNSFDLQSIRIASLYQDFIERLQDVFPSFIFGLERERIDLLITAIGDDSADGNYISTNEQNFVNDHRLTQLWNNTVKEWNSGKWSFFDHNGIPFASMKQLIASADRLKSFNRQNGGLDPFSVLHEYLGQLLKTTSHPETICLQATSFVSPRIVYENDAITIDIFVKNLKEISISQVALSIDIVRDNAFSPQAKLVANGISVNTLSAQGILPPNSSFISSWTKRIVFSNQLTSVANYQLIIALSFMVEGRETKQRLITRTLKIHPIRSLKIVHFVSPTLQSSNVPFSLMTSIMNNGYTNLRNVRVESTDLQVSSAQDAPLQFHIDTLKLNDDAIEPATSFDVGDIPSGTSRVITMNISSSDSLATLSKIKSEMSADGTTIGTDDSSIYKVHATAGLNGILVSVMDYDEPLFFFRPETGNLVNIIPLEFQKSSTEEAKQPTRTIVQSTFQNKESRSFFGYLFGSLPYPNVPENYELVQIREQNINRPRDVRPIVWVEESEKGKVLHFIDGGSLNPSYEQSYDFVFADPTELSVPYFSQNAYRIQLQRDDWPTAGSTVGHISVENDNSDVEYSLFSPDDSSTFSVHPQTGHIFMDSPALPGNEFCLLLKAKKTNGEEASVPVSINTGGTRRDCVTFNTYGLTPRVHLGPIEFPTPPTFAPSIPTNPTMSTEPPETTAFPTTTESSLTSDFPTPPDVLTTEQTNSSPFPTPDVLNHTRDTSDFPHPSVFPTQEYQSSTTSEFPTPSIFTPTPVITTTYPTDFPQPSGLPSETTEEPFSSTSPVETTEYSSTHEVYPDSTLSPFPTPHILDTTTTTESSTIFSTLVIETTEILISTTSEIPIISTTPELTSTTDMVSSTIETIPTPFTHFPLDATTTSIQGISSTTTESEVTAPTTNTWFTNRPWFPTPSKFPPWTTAFPTTESVETTTELSSSTHFVTPDYTISSIDVSTSDKPTTLPTPSTTENPFFGNACIKTSSSIYSLICQMDKLIVQE